MNNPITITQFKGNKDILLPKRKNGLALLHPSTMKRLLLKINSPILIKTLNGGIILKAWPYDLLEESAVALPGHAAFRHYISKSNIEKFEGSILPADRIVFRSMKYKKFMHTKSFKTLMLDYLNSVYVKEEMILHVNYLGYSCCFIVQKVNSSLQENDYQNQLNNDNELNDSLNLSNVDNSQGDGSELEMSFSEKCSITKSLKSVSQFQSSTPISSPKIIVQNKSCLQNLEYPDLKPVETFYYVHNKTNAFFQVEDLVHKPKFSLKFEDIGSLDEQKDYLKSTIDSFLNCGESAKSEGIFIIGPSGTGKSMLVKAIQSEYNQELPIYLVPKHLSSSDNIITLMTRIFKDAEENSPSILILDNVDQIGDSESFTNASKKQKTLPYQVSSLMHKLLISESKNILIATSQNDSSIFTDLQKHVSTLKELRIPIPSSIDRKNILLRILRKFPNNLTAQEISDISEKAHGFTGADLNRLCEKATRIVSERSKSNERRIGIFDVVKSLDFVQPSSMEEFKFEVPNVRWNDIGGMEEVKAAVKEMVDWPLKYPEQFKKLNITPSRGILMYGPPGCCKTMIAKALATESQLNFIYMKHSQVFNMYVGDSEKSVSEVFKKARAAAPCVLFFDEVESLAPKRGSSSGSSNVADRVITQILIEIDGIDVLQEGVCVIAATNQPHKIDPSLLRPGRLDRLIYVPLPDVATRKEIFEVILRKKPVSPQVDMSYLVDKTEGFTGAEIVDLCSQACLQAIKEDITSTTSVLNMSHFQTSLASLKPRTTSEMIEVFKNYKNSKTLEL